ncbi:MAG: hypothetical protein ABMA14_16670 [Hyphomonadaceae bacterium]
MNGTSAKLVYCLMLMVLVVFVAMPRTQHAMVTAEVTAATPSTESRLAKAIHERIAIQVAGELPARQLNQLTAEEQGLRQLAFADDAQGARAELIDSLADELSAAMLRRSEIVARTGPEDHDNAERDRMEEVVRALTAAINNEVRGVSA